MSTTLMAMAMARQVKNVSGRFLVGLRWWHEVQEDGSGEWRFESLDEEGQKTIDNFEKRVFWWSTYLTTAIWVLFGIVSFFRLELEYLILVLIALAMSTSNLVGYVKASRDQRKNIGSFMDRMKTAVAVKSLF